MELFPPGGDDTSATGELSPVFRISALGTFAASTQTFAALTTTVILD